MVQQHATTAACCTTATRAALAAAAHLGLEVPHLVQGFGKALDEDAPVAGLPDQLRDELCGTAGHETFSVTVAHC